MKIEISPAQAQGAVMVSGSKSEAHRLLIAAALATGESILTNLPENDDIAATVAGLRAFGAEITASNGRYRIRGTSVPCTQPNTVIPCGESGSTLRFLLPIALLCEQPVTFTGSDRLFARGLQPFAALCNHEGLLWQQAANRLTVCGPLLRRSFSVSGSFGSQFISGLLFALSVSGGGSITVQLPFYSRFYALMTVRLLHCFGADITVRGGTFTVAAQKPCSKGSYTCAGDASTAANFAALNEWGGTVTVNGLLPDSLQGDLAYPAYFTAIRNGFCCLDLSDCPDLFPILCVLAATHSGAVFCGTERLRYKESDRVAAMQQALALCGVSCIVQADSFVIWGKPLPPAQPLCGQGDHRIVMALAVLLSRLGGTVTDAEAVQKSTPQFFGQMRQLGIPIRVLGTVGEDLF